MTALYLNLNGNTKDDLVKQYREVRNALRVLENKLVKSDFFHGRNATDYEHQNELMEVKKEMFGRLGEFEEMLEEVTEPIKS